MPTRFLFCDSRTAVKRQIGSVKDFIFSVPITVDETDKVAAVYFYPMSDVALTEPVALCCNIATTSSTLGTRTLQVLTDFKKTPRYFSPWLVDCAKGHYDSIVVSLMPTKAGSIVKFPNEVLLVLQIVSK